MNFKDWLLWKAKTAGERSDLYHKKGRSFISAVEAGKEEAYKEIADSKFLAFPQADPADPIPLCPFCEKPMTQVFKCFKCNPTTWSGIR